MTDSPLLAACRLGAATTRVQSFTGLTGSASVSWDLFDFSVAPFRATTDYSVLRLIVDLDCVAISSNDNGNTYPIYYATKFVYGWKSSTFGGIISANNVLLNSGSGQITWALTNTGGAGSPRMTATGQASTNVFNVVMCANIRSYVDA